MSSLQIQLGYSSRHGLRNINAMGEVNFGWKKAQERIVDLVGDEQ
jgi:hypothetical protein